MITRNPFRVTSPEDLSPEEVKELFVKSYTELNTLRSPKHTMVYGSRGNGKSMLLRFLEPKCQALDFGLSVNEYLQKNGSFIGIYVPFKEGYLNKDDLNALEPTIRLKLSKHLINIHIVTCFFDIINLQLADALTDLDRDKIKEVFLRFFDGRNIHDHSLSYDRLQKVLKAELRLIDHYISFFNFPDFHVKYEGNLTDYHTFIRPFFDELRTEITALKNTSFYLLFDECDRLYHFQKIYLNTFIANRDHKIITVKLASKIAGYDHYYTESGELIKEIHDFDIIVLDQLYTHSRDIYFNKVKDIATRRLELAGFKVKIEDFLPESLPEKKLYDEIKVSTALEWEQLADKDKTDDRSNYVRKYSAARLFQHLAKKKIKKRYSGFENIVHFSSGILRNFLRPCYKMYQYAIDEEHDILKYQFIPENIQNETIYELSNSFFDELNQALEGLKEGDKIVIINKLKSLISNLGHYYYSKLTDETSRDPRIISFVLKDEPDISTKEVLNYAVRESFFHKIYSTSKAGGGRFDGYVLNRALCPRYKLDLSSLRGRVLFQSDVIRKMMEDINYHKQLTTTAKGAASSMQGELFSIKTDGDDDE